MSAQYSNYELATITNLRQALDEIVSDPRFVKNRCATALKVAELRRAIGISEINLLAQPVDANDPEPQRRRSRIGHAKTPASDETCGLIG